MSSETNLAVDDDLAARSYRAVFEVEADIACADWADNHFYLSSESSNTPGQWKTASIQRAILNAFGSDAIEKVDFFKPTRFGGTKMDIAAAFYFIAHKRRNLCFYQPTQTDSDEFVKSEIDPAIRDCDVINGRLTTTTAKDSKNTLGFKGFLGCNAYFKGGHSGSSYERMTLDAVILDELDLFNADVSKRGDPTTLSWGRVRNSLFKKQIQTSKPTVEGFSLIEKSSKAAADMLHYQVPCPECGDYHKIEWGGKDVPYGFKWQERDPSTVMHVCPGCGVGWRNEALYDALEDGYWEGERGWKTHDGLMWFFEGEQVPAPRHIAFATWSGYSTFLPWSQIVEEWYDALGNIEKIQSFTNNTLGQVFKIEHSGTLSKETIDGMMPTDDLSDVIAITAGIDTQDDRLEVQYVGHDRFGNVYVLAYMIYTSSDMTQQDVYLEMARDLLEFQIECGSRILPVYAAGIDTQGHHTPAVHEFLKSVRNRKVFFGINGNGSMAGEIADKPSLSKSGGGQFFNIGTNPLKQIVMNAIRNFEEERGAFRIWSGAQLPPDYSAQLTAEKMEVRRVNGVERIVFTNEKDKRNEALDTMVYALAAKAYIKAGHRGYAGKRLFPA